MKSSINDRVGRRAGRMVASAWVALGLGLIGAGSAGAADADPGAPSVGVSAQPPVAAGSVSPPPVEGPPIALVPVAAVPAAAVPAAPAAPAAPPASPAPASSPGEGGVTAAPAPAQPVPAASAPQGPTNDALGGSVVITSRQGNVGSAGVPPAVTASKEPDGGRVQQVSEAPRPEAAVSAIPALAVKPDDDDATHDRGFPASSIQLGGGLSEFSRGQMRSEAGRGPYWDLRGVLGLRRLVSFEAALVGAAYPMASDRYGSGATLLRNGFEAGPRINIPVEDKAGLILLYGSAGLGWSNYRVVGGDMPGAMVSSDYAATLPLAAGITFGYQRFLVDVRLGYRLTFQDELLTSTASPGGESRLRDYSVGAQVGYEF
jgi:hypothetical protein